MSSFDLVPNAGNFYLPEKDEADEVKANAERTETLQVLPFLEDVVNWFDEQAEELDRKTAINLKHPTLSVAEQMHGYQVAIELLQKKKGEIQTFFEAYKPKQ